MVMNKKTQALIDIIQCQENGKYSSLGKTRTFCIYSPEFECKFRYAIEEARTMEINGVKKVIVAKEYYCSKWVRA